MVRIFIILAMFSFLIKAEANVVHIVYFQPADQPDPTNEDIGEIEDIMLETQYYYSKALYEHGHIPKTFYLQRDKTGEMIIHIVKGKHDVAVYSDPKRINEELPRQILHRFLENEKILIVFIAGLQKIMGREGVAGKECLKELKNEKLVKESCGNTAYIPIHKELFHILRISIHELGHCFGFDHNDKQPPANKQLMMASLHIIDLNNPNAIEINGYVLDANEAGMLSKHSYFTKKHLSVPASMLTIRTWAALKTEHR